MMSISLSWSRSITKLVLAEIPLNCDALEKLGCENKLFENMIIPI